MTEAEINELSKLLEGNPNAKLVWHEDESGNGWIVEIDNGKNFKGVIHPVAALDIFRGK